MSYPGAPGSGPPTLITQKPTQIGPYDPPPPAPAPSPVTYYPGAPGMINSKPTQIGGNAMAMATPSWQRQKTAALDGKIAYEWAVGPGYDRIPSDITVHGFPNAYSDLARHDAANHGACATLPADRRNVGKYGTKADWQKDGGFVVMSPHATMMHLAPTFPNLPDRGVQNLAGMQRALYVVNTQHGHGHTMPGGTQRVLHTSVHQRNANNPVGMLTVPNAPEQAQHGSFLYNM